MPILGDFVCLLIICVEKKSLPSPPCSVRAEPCVREATMIQSRPPDVSSLSSPGGSADGRHVREKALPKLRSREVKAADSGHDQGHRFHFQACVEEDLHLVDHVVRVRRPHHRPLSQLPGYGSRRMLNLAPPAFLENSG